MRKKPKRLTELARYEVIEGGAARCPGAEQLGVLDLCVRAVISTIISGANSGHPGGSLSASLLLAAAVTEGMTLNYANPDHLDNDVLVLAGGHKAPAHYALFATLNQLISSRESQLMPDVPGSWLQFEDLLGFRRNRTDELPLSTKFGATPLDGHPTSATPWVPFATGASGVGTPTAIGYALGQAARYGSWRGAPRVVIVDGEGGLTPGIVNEALAMAVTARLGNVVFLVDWNNASIDSDRVCPDGQQPGDYVQWTPPELFRHHGWNVIVVPDGHDPAMVLRALHKADSQAFANGLPTAIVCRTVKGFGYGKTGRQTHGTGHALCSPEFYQALAAFEQWSGQPLPRHDLTGADDATRERACWELLQHIQRVLMGHSALAKHLVGKMALAHSRWQQRVDTGPDANATPRLATLYCASSISPDVVPQQLRPVPGEPLALRQQAGLVLGYIGELTGGAVYVLAADLLDSTSVREIARSYPQGFFNAEFNPASRLVAVGGICEYGASAAAVGLACTGHLPVVSSYAAFLSALGHIPMRLHAIGEQARYQRTGEPYRTVIWLCAHAGFETGEDGATHADPQALQLLQGNFPPGSVITLTPWSPDEVWPLLVYAFQKRPIAVPLYVTRPAKEMLNREDYYIESAQGATQGVYALRPVDYRHPDYAGTVILQGSGVTYEFVTQVLPQLDKAGLKVNVLCVTSRELFELLPAALQKEILPEAVRREAMGITDFTLPTIEWAVTSALGRELSLHAFSAGHYPGSGSPAAVLQEMGLDGTAQLKRVLEYIFALRKRKEVIV